VLFRESGSGSLSRVTKSNLALNVFGTSSLTAGGIEIENEIAAVSP
jgi:hypothetical protein